MSVTIVPWNKRFLELKWVIAEQFQEYLLWKPFIVRTDNNPLTYIRTTPNLDATWHWWIHSLARFTFSIEYQKGWDNVAADTISQVTLKWDIEIVKYILDGVTMGMTNRTDTQNPQDPMVAKADEDFHKPVQETVVLARAAQVCIDLHLLDWVTTGGSNT